MIYIETVIGAAILSLSDISRSYNLQGWLYLQCSNSSLCKGFITGQ